MYQGYSSIKGIIKQVFDRLRSRFNPVDGPVDGGRVDAGVEFCFKSCLGVKLGLRFMLWGLQSRVQDPEALEISQASLCRVYILTLSYW